jgi:hypothetical protein
MASHLSYMIHGLNIRRKTFLAKASYHPLYILNIFLDHRILLVLSFMQWVLFMIFASELVVFS